MKEFGSDFHYMDSFKRGGKTIGDFFPCSNFYADGRQALVHLYRYFQWKRLWVPEYFCYDVLESLKESGLNLAFYTDYPGYYDQEEISRIPFSEGDALLRVNYFGTRSFRDSSIVPSPVPVVEDHTHDLLGEWALGSKADWCIASLRKTLPIPEGGILWSPKGLPLPHPPLRLQKNEVIAGLRWKGMALKRDYLHDEPVQKEEFRKLLVGTEPYFDSAEVSLIDKETEEYLSMFDVEGWYARKKENWREIKSTVYRNFDVLPPEDPACNPFSATIVCGSKENRDGLRNRLISSNIYPAVLWSIPEGESVSFGARSFSERMLSIHCDGRYSIHDIMEMKQMIMSIE